MTMKTAPFTFDPETHVYTMGGCPVPGTTDIVGDVYGSPQYANEWHMNRGSMIHKAISLFLRGRLDEKTVDERIRGRLEASKKAIRELSLTWSEFAEKPMGHPLYRYGGTPDLPVGNRLCDWKSSHMDTTCPQFGGYLLLLEANGYPHKIKDCIEIVLTDEGTYSITTYKAARCKGLFLAALTVYQYKKGDK